MIILFFIGIKDDLVGTAPVKKLIGHLVVAFILVIMADIRITDMYGLFGVLIYQTGPVYCCQFLRIQW